MKKNLLKNKLFLSISLLCLGYTTAQAQCVPTFPPGEGCAFGDQVHTFQLNGDGSSKINDIFSGCSAGSYKNATGSATVLLTEGSAYTANVSSNNTDDYLAIWVDFNGNDIFETSERIVAYSSSLASGFTTTPVAFTIPAGVISGTFTMRVMVGYPYNLSFNPISATDFDPCNAGTNRISYGEIHDYSVEIIASPLTVSLGKLAGFWQAEHTVQLDWTTLTENNIEGFKIYKSEDGKEFKEIGYVVSQAPGGNSVEPLNYSFMDAQAKSEKVFYKVGQVDNAGMMVYTNIVMLKQKVIPTSFVVSPNPANNILHIQLGKIEPPVTIQILNLQGKKMEQVIARTATLDIDISDYPAGPYIVQYLDGNDVKSIKIIKQQ